MKSFLKIVCGAGLLAPLHGAVMVEDYSFSSSLAPQDGTGIPSSDSHVISGSSIGKITDLTVSVSLLNPAQAGAYNGDYYLSLQHDSGFSVLLNRVGRRAGASFSASLGYSDNGLNVTFSDQAESGDIHLYRTQLSGNNTTPIDSNFNLPLTGVWAPDGRATSPLSVLDTDARTALLSSFNNLPANGTWTLQIIDFNSGGTATIENWGLTISGTAVPEPRSVVAVGVTLCAFALLRRRISQSAACVRPAPSLNVTADV